MRKITLFLPFAAIALVACRYSVWDAAENVMNSSTSA